MKPERAEVRLGPVREALVPDGMVNGAAAVLEDANESGAKLATRSSASTPSPKLIVFAIRKKTERSNPSKTHTKGA